MNPLYTIITITALIIGFFVVKKINKEKRRNQLKNKPFSPEWEKFLQENVVLYNYLPEELQKKLQGLIHVFLDEKHFEGCGGIELTDEMKVTVAAQACILLLNQKHDYFSKLVSILIYPSAYTSMEKRMENGLLVEGPSTRLGESWTTGTLILAWDCVKRESRDIKDGNNVIFHEFAHQLDQEDGVGDGVPILDEKDDYGIWAKVLSGEYTNFLRKVKRRQRDIIDEYGATNPAEFFAVITEAFFKKPIALKHEHPDLYEELQAYYKMDPVTWYKKGNTA